MTDGSPLMVRCAVKPIPTLMQPLRTVDLATGKPVAASVERSDVCAVPAASVVGEAALAFELARAFTEKFGGDCVGDMRQALESYLDRINGRWPAEA